MGGTRKTYQGGWGVFGRRSGWMDFGDKGRNWLEEVQKIWGGLFSLGLEDFGDEAGPAGLMGGAHSPSVIAVKIFVE